MTNVRSKEIESKPKIASIEDSENLRIENHYSSKDINKNLVNFLSKSKEDDLAEIRRMLKQVNQGITFAEREFGDT